MADWALMTAFMFDHLVMFAVFAALVLYPVGRILGRLGLSPFWSIFAVIPLANLILLWALAFIDWPAHPGPAAK